VAHMIDLSAEPRSIVGKKVKQLRAQGKIPANMYGHGVDSTSIQVETKALLEALRHATSTTLINLKIGKGGKAQPVFVRDVRYALLKRVPLHVDFFAVRMDEKMRATVSLVLSGESPAAKSDDYMLLHPHSTLPVEGRPGDLPEALAVDVSHLTEVDQAIYVRDLQLPEGVTVLLDPDELLVRVTMTRAALEPVTTAETGAAADAAAGAASTDEATTASSGESA